MDDSCCTSNCNEPSPLSHVKLQRGFLLTFSIILDINFLQSSQQTAPYFLGCLRVVIELQTWHTSDVVKIDEERFELEELRLSENGLLIVPGSRSWGLPKRPKVVESWSTGLRRIEEDDKALLASGGLSGSLRSFPFLVDFKSNSSTKLKPWRKKRKVQSLCKKSPVNICEKFLTSIPNLTHCKKYFITNLNSYVIKRFKLCSNIHLPKDFLSFVDDVSPPAPQKLGFITFFLQDDPESSPVSNRNRLFGLITRDELALSLGRLNLLATMTFDDDVDAFSRSSPLELSCCWFAYSRPNFNEFNLSMLFAPFFTISVNRDGCTMHFDLYTNIGYFRDSFLMMDTIGPSKFGL